nr:hypothetical protein [Desulfobulbaceae bacterium]
MTVNKLFAILALLVLNLTTLCPDVQAADATLIYPPDKSSVTQSTIQVVGIAPQGSTNIKITVKNSSGVNDYSTFVTNKAFSQLVDLRPGENTITINGSAAGSHSVLLTDAAKEPQSHSPFVLHSKNILTMECDKCHPKSVPGKVGFTYVQQNLSCITDKCHANLEKKEFKHGPFADQHCIQCHNPHGTQHTNFVVNVRAELCYRCHVEAATMTNEGQYVHFPVTKGECLLCHEHHESNLAYHLKRDTILDLCLGCHTKNIIEHKVMHEPVESGDCSACHSPHISNFKGLLSEGGKDLCIECHEIRKEEFESKYVHEPVSKDCNLCHDPHGSSSYDHLKTAKDENGKYLTVQNPLKALCISCHLKSDPQVIDQIENSTVAHKPVQEGKCTECHTPHSSNFSKQLNAPLKEICFRCHPDIKKTITESQFQHGPVRTNDCAQCHLVHGSNHKNLLRAEYSLNYQGDYDPKNFELCFGCHNSKVIEENNSLDTGFRNGTRNLHFVHVHRDKNGRFCITCHDTHASDQEKHIRKSFTFKKKFKITMDFTKTATGGGCVVGCHKPRKYDRENPVN